MVPEAVAEYHARDPGFPKTPYSPQGGLDTSSLGSSTYTLPFHPVVSGCLPTSSVLCWKFLESRDWGGFIWGPDTHTRTLV